eukprot:COSAG06_NODE_68466_length_223_cov_1478.064516_1_plen_34_part_01
MLLSLSLSVRQPVPLLAAAHAGAAALSELFIHGE